MEQKSKKIVKENKSSNHGRSKFEREQGLYIAEHIKKAIEDGKKLVLSDIKKMMFKLSKEFIDKGNKGKSVTSLGTTTIYTFLEKNGIPAPLKAKTKKSEQSAKQDHEFESVEKREASTSKSLMVQSPLDQDAQNQTDNHDWNDEVSKLEEQKRAHLQIISEIEKRLSEIDQIRKNSVPFDVMIDYSSESGSSNDTDFKDLEELYQKENGRKLKNNINFRLQYDEINFDKKVI